MPHIWLPCDYAETISFATRNEKYFIELEYPNLLNQVQCTTLPKPTITSSIKASVAFALWQTQFYQFKRLT